MTGDRWPRINELFEAALQRDPVARSAFLAGACGSDEELRRDVESLLAAHAVADGFLSAAPAEEPPPQFRAGTRLGPYEVLGPLGAGGMGEVYRARDARLGRDVAVKVLPRSLAGDRGRLLRFEQEARAAGRLNHPHVLAVFDVGTQDGLPYIVSELLEGSTLRARLDEGPLSVPRAAEYGAQIARGLAAAHAGGIVHRDLKPDNVFVSREGHVKLLDFGLARAIHPGDVGEDATRPASAHTAPGVLLGTLPYMSPEQARGEPADTRADVFALGAILFEMVTGQRAFRRATPAETAAAVLHHDPLPQLEAHPLVPAGLARLVRRCLEKHPGERFQSAADLAFELDAFTGSPSTRTGEAPVARLRSRAPATTVAAALLALGALAAAYFLGARRAAPGAGGIVPSYRQLTFRRGTVDAARFSPDGNTVYYGASWAGGRPELYSTRLDGFESRALDLAGARLVAVAPGEMAVLRGTTDAGALARVPLEGGAPREVLTGVMAADWSADGRQLAVVRRDGDRVRLEFPPGRPVYETVGTLVSPRLSPDGGRVAVVDQPMLGNTVGSLVVVDGPGRSRALSEAWADIGGVAWSRGGGEVWFTASRAGNARSLHAVTLSGAYRLVSRTPAATVLQDISSDGRVLLTHAHPRCEAIGRLAGDTGERDLSWYDWTHVTDFGPDGRMLFTAEGEGGGPLYTAYLRRTPNDLPVRLGEGHSTELSPDGQAALCLVRSTPPRLLVLPTGAGEARTLAGGRTFAEIHWAWWFPDGRRVLFLANEAGRPAQLFVQDLTGKDPRPLAPPGVAAYRHRPIIPDGTQVLALVPGPPGPRFVLWPMDDEHGARAPADVPGLGAGDQPLQWTEDGRGLFVRRAGPVFPVAIDRLEIATGKRTPWRELQPSDTAGVGHIGDVLITPDGGSYAYNCQRSLSDLYVAEGLR
jgi:eukaryotic-like serine/threonine-protein kinase